MTNNDVNFIQIFGVIKILQYICIQKNLNVNQMVNAYCDIKNSVDTAKREGIAEGMEKGMKEGMEKGMKEGMEKGMNQRSLEIARNMLADGVDINLIMKYSGLTQEQIEKLK